MSSDRSASRLATIRRARAMYRSLAELYPDARCELDFSSAWELIVATVLSAQSTDKRVNLITPQLFSTWPTPAALASARRDELETVIHPTGFFRAKADHLLKMAAIVERDHDGKVPNTMAELVALPGVGRKTANVVLGNAFGVPGITPDTHFMRLTRRFGWTTATTPDKIEAEVGELFDKKDWVQLCHVVIWHGRRRCHARRPACGVCPVAVSCPSYGEGPIDAADKEKLVREPRG